jgi:uncharacterized protein
MIRLLLLIAIVALLLWLLFGRGRERRAGRPTSGAEHMVRCARCGIHLPRSEALLQDGRTYCSAAHRDLGVVDR